MRKIVRLMKNWQFIGPEGNTTAVDLPHTWNAIDGQDGGNDYWRGTCVYRTRFAAPAFEEVSQQVWLQFEGVNASAKVILNDTEVCVHDGGYSTFRANITTLLREENILTVEVDNRVNDHVYPQKADFTFYGGIYRDVSLLVVHKDHIALGHYGDTGVKVTPTLCKDHTADIRVETRLEGEGTVRVTLNDAEGNTVAAAEGKDVTMTLAHPHLWDGVKDPYLYTCVVELEQGGEVVDTVSTRVGVRSFRVDPKKGFFLNGRPYRRALPLRAGAHQILVVVDHHNGGHGLGLLQRRAHMLQVCHIHPIGGGQHPEAALFLRLRQAAEHPIAPVVPGENPRVLGLSLHEPVGLEALYHIPHPGLIDVLSHTRQLRKQVVGPQHILAVGVKDHHRHGSKKHIAGLGGVGAAGDALHILVKLLLHDLVAPPAHIPHQQGRRHLTGGKQR